MDLVGATVMCSLSTRTASAGAHQVGALRAGRTEQQRADQCRPGPQAGIRRLWRAADLQEGRIRHRPGPSNRHLAIDPRRRPVCWRRLLGNLGVEPEPKATIQRFDADGSNQTTFASGTRNPTALPSIHRPANCGPWLQEARRSGRRLPSDYSHPGTPGGFYGWPYGYIGKHPQPGFANRAPDKVEATITPDLLFEAHSSVLDLVFYDADQFPPEYKGHAFVALKGSWNRSEPTGYKVGGALQGRQGRGLLRELHDGFWASGERRAESVGPPRRLAVMKDGSLLIADDTGGTIWRVTYTGLQKTQ